MMKLIELKKCLMNVVTKLFGYNDQYILLNPNAYIDRIRLEYSIFDLKVDLYQKCFSSLDYTFVVGKMTSFVGLNPIPCKLDRINLVPINYVFLDQLHISMEKFRNINAPNRISVIKDRNYMDIYTIRNFRFSDEFKPLIKEINFEIHKLFLKDNLDKFNLEPYAYKNDPILDLNKVWILKQYELPLSN